MNRIILCEGMTDAILLSYYLERVCGWSYLSKTPKEIAIKENDNESVNWYKKGNDNLLICGVGGKDNMESFFKEKILRPIFVADAFSRIAVILDRDAESIESIENHVSTIFRPIINVMANNEWIMNKYTDGYGFEKEIDALLVVIPPDQQGALETLLLEAISENPYDAVIVEQAGNFINKIQSTASRYIGSRRQALKAHLGVTWAIKYPEKVFRFMDEQIRSVKWEKSVVLRECFKKLIEI